MMKSDEQYQVPVWMRPLLPLLCNTGGNDPEELLNDTETTASANIVRYVLIVAVRSQIDLLQLLYRKGLLRTEIPGGFWICPYISRHLLSLNPLLACCRRYSRGER